jgi:hypothetical protein
MVTVIERAIHEVHPADCNKEDSPHLKGSFPDIQGRRPLKIWVFIANIVDEPILRLNILCAHNAAVELKALCYDYSKRKCHCGSPVHNSVHPHAGRETAMYPWLSVAESWWCILMTPGGMGSKVAHQAEARTPVQPPGKEPESRRSHWSWKYAVGNTATKTIMAFEMSCSKEGPGVEAGRQKREYQLTRKEGWIKCQCE